MNLDALDPGILLPALLAGLLVTATHVPLGRQVLQRGIVFIDLAIAQIAGLGVIIANTLGFAGQAWQVQVAAVTAALLGAGLLTWTDRRWHAQQEAIIGVVFVLAASLGLLLLAHDAHGGDRLRDLLVGQILWVTLSDLWPVALLYAGILGLWFGLGARLGNSGFYVLFALSVTAAVQLVGVYLVFASLIVPALAMQLLGRSTLWIGYVLGGVGYALGLAASAVLDLPSGATIVCTLCVVALAWMILSRGR